MTLSARLLPQRGLLVLLHRYVGLVLAGFLLIAGISGALLAWNDELEALAAPELMLVTPPPGARPLDALLLREKMLAYFPGLQLPYAALHMEQGRSLMYSIKRRPPAADGSIGDDQAFINPYTGELLGTRKWGDLAQGRKNWMPFIYRLHTSLVLGTVGTYAFGVISLLWTLDCFVGAWLTFPPRTSKPAAKSWGARWWPAWRIRRVGGHKLVFDMHRAGGLWPWALLLVIAWSGVAFNLKEVYQPVMASLFAHQLSEDAYPPLAEPQLRPGLDWRAARAVARRLMDQQAAQLGFSIEGEDALMYIPDRALYVYDVKSSLDVARVNGVTRLIFDANSGELRGRWLPSGAAAGDTIRSWITLLHRAAIGGVLGGVPIKTLISMIGLATTALSITGVLIWMKKRRARSLALPVR
ncbi:PepSY domain-containing protein [Duganella sp. FT80W]|uniref:PepSY domain-containing protein n=1 Tax=Duganella guangzhouensis TaxID=2666084 RepID=A0A6I2L6Q7_9BURK|nr:PepSY-associated TM helix domain-containing protein [Duganella guangzhouensis]MRW93450.1 PepSY domain-containing protein [Duganella guangzhouensis]